MRRRNWFGLWGALLAVISPAMLPPVLPNPPDNLSWTTVLAARPPVARPRGGSRGEGDEIYLIAPGAIGKSEVWSDQPLFVWQGTIRQLELLTDAAIIWSQTLAAADRWVSYSGRPLQPGSTYEWVVYNSAKSVIAQATFQIMSAAKRDQITADLAAIAAQLSTATVEETALQRANYFAERQLWADVLREACSVPNPSEQLARCLEQWFATL